MTDRTDGSSFVWNGRRLAYESYGDGDRVLVLLHGLLMDARLNRGLARALASRGYRVVLLDLLGHGASDKPVHAAEYRFDVYADLVHPFSDAAALVRQMPNARLVQARRAVELRRRPRRLFGEIERFLAGVWDERSRAVSVVAG